MTWHGGTTGNDPLQGSAYYGRFSVVVDGVALSTVGVATNSGYTGAISGTAGASGGIYRVGRANNVHNNHFGGGLNQVAVWDTDQTANVATIYNSGATQDLSLLADAPDHVYEIGASVTTITDSIGSADLTGYNLALSDIVTDSP